MSNDDDVLSNSIPAPYINRQPWDGLQAYLSGLKYPATKQSILKMLRWRGGLGEAVATAEKIPDREYKDCEAVRAEFLKV